MRNLPTAALAALPPATEPAAEALHAPPPTAEPLNNAMLAWSFGHFPRGDEASGGRHHSLGLDGVAAVEGRQVRLAQPAGQARRDWRRE